MKCNGRECSYKMSRYLHIYYYKICNGKLWKLLLGTNSSLVLLFSLSIVECIYFSLFSRRQNDSSRFNFLKSYFFVNPSHYTHWYELAIYDETFYWINRPLFKYDNGSHSMQLFVFWLIFSKPISRGDLNISNWLCAHFARCIFTYIPIVLYYRNLQSRSVYRCILV